MKNYYFKEIKLDDSPNPYYFYYDIEECEEYDDIIEKPINLNEYLILNKENENSKNMRKIENEEIKFINKFEKDINDINIKT